MLFWSREVFLKNAPHFNTDNPHIAHRGQFKLNGSAQEYALIKPQKMISIFHGENDYKAILIRGELHLFNALNLEKIKSLQGLEDQKISALSNASQKALNWLEFGETGSSSLALCATIFPELKPLHPKLKDRDSYPKDVSDFKRCMAFFEAVPEAKKNLVLMKKLSPVWSNLVDNWSGIEACLHKDTKEAAQLIQHCTDLNALKKKPMP